MTLFLVLGFVGLGIIALALLVGDVFDGMLDLDVLDGDVFSTAAIGGFLSAGGFGAAIAGGVGAPLIVSLPVGAVAGVAMAWFAIWLTRLLKDDATDATPTTGDAVGREATVVTAVPADGFGTVRVRIGGHERRLNARLDSDHPMAIEAGTAVHVTGILSPTAVSVAPVWRELN
ncbi:NfeD family protein [Nocardioides acrostichi]|uniref:NfeD family protein n=1 Tax=Nocardioides acrostichi TaxID=2784339 RepID=A0A930UXW6_9ACTN|nr:NfeD family protein [Nocardioides acrostichi]MBF4161080.1 NfeD family protein [Nocardioides acrostichi]